MFASFRLFYLDCVFVFRCVEGVMCELMPLLIEGHFEHNYFFQKDQVENWNGILKLLDDLELYDLKGMGDIV